MTKPTSTCGLRGLPSRLWPLAIPRPNGGNARAAHGSISPRIAVQQTGKLVEIKMPRQQIPAAEIDDRVVTGLAAGVAIGFDHAYVFAFDALADGR